jgi:hypothetical protein
MGSYYVLPLKQGGPSFFFPLDKSGFPDGPKGQENPPGTTFKTSSQSSLFLTILIQKKIIIVDVFAEI